MIKTNNSESGHLSRKIKWIYGCGDIGFSITDTFLGFFFAIFLIQVVGLSPGIAGIAILIGRIWDCANDPIMGYLSDRTRSRWGRRKPFLLFGAIPFALTFILLWVRPPLQHEISLAVYYAVCYLLFDTAFTVTFMPYAALTPELTPNYNERTSLTSYRMLFSIVGSLIAISIPLLLIETFRPEKAFYMLILSIFFALVSIIPFFLIFFNIKEKEEFKKARQPRLWDSLKSVLKNPPFLFGVGIFIFTLLAIDIMRTILILFIRYNLNREAESGFIMMLIFITAILALPLWNFISKKLGKKGAYIAGASIFILFLLSILLVTPESSLIHIIVLCIFGGIGVSSAHILPWSIFPDTIEWDEWKTGERHEGMFYSFATLALKGASILGIPSVLFLLELTGFVKNAEVQSPQALQGLSIATVLIPSIFLIFGIITALFYPLTQSQHYTILKELEIRRKSRK